MCAGMRRSAAATTAAQQPRADQQPDDRGADRDFAAVALDVRAPVGQARHLSAQLLHRYGELHAVRLDRAADLVRRALRHQPSAPGPAAGYGTLPAAASVGFAPAGPTLSRILRASSIAMLGTGGELFLTTLAAISPASAPSTTRITAIAKKPMKYVNLLPIGR